MRHRFILIIIMLITIILLFNAATSVKLEGEVESKAINGKMSEDKVEGILFNSPYQNGSWIQIENKDFEPFFSSRNKNAVVNDSLHHLMQGKYVDIDYIVTINLKSSDPINDVTKGQSCAYLVNRDDFNKAKIGGKIIFEVSRFKVASIKNMALLIKHR